MPYEKAIESTAACHKTGWKV